MYYGINLGVLWFLIKVKTRGLYTMGIYTFGEEPVPHNNQVIQTVFERLLALPPPQPMQNITDAQRFQNLADSLVSASIAANAAIMYLRVMNNAILIPLVVRVNADAPEYNPNQAIANGPNFNREHAQFMSLVATLEQIRDFSLTFGPYREDRNNDDKFAAVRNVAEAIRQMYHVINRYLNDGLTNGLSEQNKIAIRNFMTSLVGFMALPQPNVQ